MQVSMKSLAAVSALTLSSLAAVAAPGPIPDPIAGPGGYILSAWDPIANVGTTQYLGSTLTNFNSSNNQTFSIDMSVFNGNTTNVIYNVTAADYQGPTSSPLDWQLAYTSSASGILPAYSGVELANGAASVQGHVGRVNLACGTAAKCDATAANAWYPGNLTFTTNLNAALPFNTTAGVGTALNFYILTGSSDLLDDPAANVRVANGGNFASWSLSAAGTLTYSAGGGTQPVPLPAAVWLLLSGIGGLSAVGRRRRAVTA